MIDASKHSGAVSTSLSPYWRILLVKIIEIKKALTRSIFELEKCSFFFFQMGQNIDWNHYQGASPAPNNDKGPLQVKCHIRAQWGGGANCICKV